MLKISSLGHDDRRLRLCQLIAGWSAVLVLMLFGPCVVGEAKEFEQFKQLRQELLDVLGKAQKRVWVQTPVITDGEIATALWLAHYRKIDVVVQLAERSKNQQMSRAEYLIKQGVPTKFFNVDPVTEDFSYVLIDRTLYRLNCSLDYLASGQKAFSIREVNSPELVQVVNSMRAINKGTSQATAQRPSDLHYDDEVLAGSASLAGKTMASNSPKNSKPGGQSSDIPRRLPSETILQRRRESGQVRDVIERNNVPYSLLHPIIVREPRYTNPKTVESQ